MNRVAIITLMLLVASCRTPNTAEREAPVTQVESVIGQRLPPRQMQRVTARLRDYALDSASAMTLEGHCDHYDSLTFAVESPESLRRETFEVWILYGYDMRLPAEKADAERRWTARVGSVIKTEIDTLTAFAPGQPCAFICSENALKFEYTEPNQAPEPTPMSVTPAAEQPARQP